MGKVSKRQRKFLSKKILPHKKKVGKRTVDKEKTAGKKSTDQDHHQQQQQDYRTPKTLPDGVDTTAFLECPWLRFNDAAKAKRDACVAPFEPSQEFLQTVIASSGSDPTNTKRRRKSTKDAVVSNGEDDSTIAGVTEQAVLNMMRAAVEQASTDDLLRLIWYLQTTRGHRDLQQKQQHLPSPPALSPRARAVLVGPQVLGRLHIAFRLHLGPKREDGSTLEEWEEAALAHRQLLEKSETWATLGGALLAFLTRALETLEEASAVVSADCNSGGIQGGSGRGEAGGGEKESEDCGSSENNERGAVAGGVLITRLRMMHSLVPLLFPFPRLARRHLGFLLGLLETSDDLTIVSLAFVRLYELATSQPMPFLHDVFKGVYRSYRTAAERIGALSRTHGGEGRGGGGLAMGRAGVLPLLRKCIAELFGVEKPSAYLVSGDKTRHIRAFSSHLHDLVSSHSLVQHCSTGNVGDSNVLPTQ